MFTTIKYSYKESNYIKTYVVVTNKIHKIIIHDYYPGTIKAGC